jgi:hypothetical protein
MQEQHLFEYAVIRIVPKVEREEFFNAGVVLYCGRQKFLKVKFEMNKLRFAAYSEQLDMAEIETYLCAFDRICAGSKEGGEIAKLPIAERFRWLTATRSTVVQTSKVHPGLCANADEMLEHLYKQMVL